MRYVHENPTICWLRHPADGRAMDTRLRGRGYEQYTQKSHDIACELFDLGTDTETVAGPLLTTAVNFPLKPESISLIVQPAWFEIVN